MKMQLNGFRFTEKGWGLIFRLCRLLLNRAAASAQIKNALKNLGLLIEKYLPGTKSVIAAHQQRGGRNSVLKTISPQDAPPPAHDAGSVHVSVRRSNPRLSRTTQGGGWAPEQGEAPSHTT